MSEWWTYSLSDFLLFSPRTYYRLFELYNRDIWPAHLLALALGLAILAMWWRGGAWRGRAVAAILAACWLFVAWAYLLERYDTINWAAKYFAIGFLLQAMLLIGGGVVLDRLAPRPASDPFGAAGLVIFVFALALQPLIAPLVGRPWAQAEIFALAPDPTVLATLGLLVAAERPHWNFLAIGCIWSSISGGTLWTMQSPDAFLMPAAAVLALSLTIWKALRASSERRSSASGPRKGL
jgi:hypothetical protein